VVCLEHQNFTVTAL